MKPFFGAALTAVFLMPSVSQSKDLLLTDDVKLACEALLCLSTGDRPHECADPIKRYFEIKHKRLHKTLQARRDFLNLCPSSREGDMPGLVDALVNGAGRCNAAELNSVMTATYIRKEERYRSNKAGGNYTIDVPVQYIRNAKPAYCQAYHQHGWTTTGDKVKFVGVEKQGGRWVDVK